MTVFDETYSVATPDGDADDPREADDRIRETKAAVQERENVDHYWPKTGNEVSDADVGEHRQITGRHQASMGTPDAAKVIIWFKTIDSVTEVMVTDDDGNEKQITTGGKLNISSAELLGILTNDTYFTAINEAGDGTVDLIKGARNEADDADVAQIPDSSRLASNAAPTEDTQIANKKYVDDQKPTLGTQVSTDSDSAALAVNEIYKVTSDGFVTAFAAVADKDLKILVDSDNTPSAVMFAQRVTNYDVAGTVPIKKDWYFQITNGDAAITAYWTPLDTDDSGECQKQ